MNADHLTLANDIYSDYKVVIDVQSGDIHASTSMSLREFIEKVAGILRQLPAGERDMAVRLLREIAIQHPV